MSYEPQLKNEIYSMLDRLAENQSPWQAKWIAHEICETHKHGLAEGEERDFWQHCGYAETRKMVTRCINMRAGDTQAAPDPQMKLPGYDRLQFYYVVKRDAEEIGISIYDMTDDELTDKANSYRDMAASCYAHADELDRFRDLRPTKSPAPASASSSVHGEAA